MTTAADKAAQSWSMWGVRATVVVAEPDVLDSAWNMVRGHLAAADVATNITREDSEIAALNRSAGTTTRVSVLLAEQVSRALEAAELTGGALDPTGGARPNQWRSVEVRGHDITLPAGLTLDLSATARSVTADRCATAVAELLDCGVLVSLGGDVATAGPEPSTGWQIKVEDLPGDPSCQVSIPSGAGLATASTLRPLHPDPDEPPRWRTVSVVAGSAHAAAAVSRAAVRGGEATLAWLGELGMPARLVDRDLSVTRLCGWP
ncbi:FAD:protein FMN transferase [Rhodococcus daqingensis]|uniref:FAD:protein FMN transferase n=1 Tax=Rhodococcus daqingensis TaxID=2479363 RepID=A0ABW2RYC5_9NOCA